jgi:hypothetical protein
VAGALAGGWGEGRAVGAGLAFTPECEPGLAKLSVSDLVRLDRAIVTISMDPKIGPERFTREGHVPLGSTPKAPPACCTTSRSSEPSSSRVNVAFLQVKSL